MAWTMWPPLWDLFPLHDLVLMVLPQRVMS